MSTTVIELLGHLVTGEVVDGAQAYPDDLVFLGIFTQGNGEFQPLDLLGQVDKSLGITLDEVETLLFVLGDGIERGVVFRQIDQLFVHDKTHQAQTIL